jgi:hypothetical protein
VAYAPTAANRRAKTADLVNQISDELRYATIILQQTPQILEFVVADRNSDGTAEKIRYEWSGTAGDPLRKTINGGTAVDVLPSVNSFIVTLEQKPKTTTFTTTTDSAETILLANTSVVAGTYRDIDISNFSGCQINPTYFPSIPANVLSWNLTKIDIHGKQTAVVNETLTIQLRPTGDPLDSPTSNVLGQVNIAESSLTNGDGFNTITFSSPVRDLTFNRLYQLVFTQLSGTGKAARLTINDSTPTGVFETYDAGASWQYMTTRQMYGRIYGTYTTPGPSYNLTRNYVSYVRLALQAGTQSHSRVETSDDERQRRLGVRLGRDRRRHVRHDKAFKRRVDRDRRDRNPTAQRLYHNHHS